MFYRYHWLLLLLRLVCHFADWSMIWYKRLCSPLPKSFENIFFDQVNLTSQAKPAKWWESNRAAESSESTKVHFLFRRKPSCVHWQWSLQSAQTCRTWAVATAIHTTTTLAAAAATITHSHTQVAAVEVDITTHKETQASTTVRSARVHSANNHPSNTCHQAQEAQDQQ